MRGAWASLRTMAAMLGPRRGFANAGGHAPTLHAAGCCPRHAPRRAAHGACRVEHAVIDDWMMWRR
jgi:hypothetical protein